MQNFDPDNPDQEMIHQCMKYARRHLNPIIDWTTDEVWEFIHKYNVPYCCLYDQGFKRLGCVGCPMGTVKNREMEFERYPKFKQAYIRAFDRMIEQRNGGGITTQSNTERFCSENGARAILGDSITNRKQNKTSREDRQNQPNECGREVRVLDESENLTPANIEVHDKKIVAVPKWGSCYNGEEVMEWWIR